MMKKNERDKQKKCKRRRT